MSFQALRQAELHLEVTKERSLYKMAIDSAKQSIRQYFSSEGVFNPPEPASKATPCSRNIKTHYSYDMAQQVFNPNDPQQPGPMYQESVPSSECAVRLMKQLTPVREPMPSSLCSITYLKYMGSGNRTFTSMLTTVGVSGIPAVACAHRASQEHHIVLHDHWVH